MKDKSMHILKKTVKDSVFTCAALGGAALIASGAAVKALTEGARFLKKSVQEIMAEDPNVVDSEVSADAEEILETEVSVDALTAEESAEV